MDVHSASCMSCYNCPALKAAGYQGVGAEKRRLEVGPRTKGMLDWCRSPVSRKHFSFYLLCLSVSCPFP
ncbi:hypothetical protein VFPBJ_06595 [Purpureocillium lilacinum]|uniref:Uncharacterized protein n=1 Tax=Purpureocillium lilacinum TaxID=33203 RepID=A0A179GKR3_PURLI|nr:hypothetical protein VFPBJ_06595 [Purpureocillium lilacinum]